MRAIPYSFGGTVYHLLLNGAALFDIYDKFGREGSVLDPIQGTDRKSFDALCWYLHKLAEQGELWRRYQGFAPGTIPKPEIFAMELGPLDVIEARTAVNAAICSGFSREDAAGRGEVDVGLLELEKKTEEALAGPST